MKLRILSPLPLALLCMSVCAQKNSLIERRDQAEGWYLPVMFNVSANGGKTNQVAVTLYKDNQQISTLTPGKKSTFELDLDLNSFYTIRVQKEGYEDKSVFIDTNMPDTQVKYNAYQCYVNMEPLDKFAHSDPFYLDFPSALVHWNNETQAFAHSDGYLANIQLKMALLAAQMETK